MVCICGFYSVVGGECARWTYAQCIRVASVRDVVAWVYAHVAVGGAGLGQERTSEDRRLRCAWDPQRGPGSCHASPTRGALVRCGASWHVIDRCHGEV